MSTLRIVLVFTAGALFAPAAAGQAPLADINLPAGALARLGSPLSGKSAFITAFALTADGKTLALVEDRSEVRFLNTATGREVRRFTVPELGATHIAFTPDGRGLACAAHRGPVRVFATADGKQTVQYGGPEWLIGSLVFSADGTALAAGNDTFAEQKMILPIWDTATGKLHAQVESIHNFQVQAALSPDGQILASWGQHVSPDQKRRQSSQSVQLWDVKTGRELRQVRTEHAVERAAFAPDGRTLAIATASAITFWDAREGKEIRVALPWKGKMVSLVFSPDGKTLAASRERGAAARWDVATGQQLGSFQGPSRSNPVLIFLTDGRLAACAVELRRATLWDVITQQPLMLAAGHQAEVTGLQFTAKGDLLRSVDAEGTVIAWDLAARAVLRQVHLPGDPAGRANRGQSDLYRFSPDGRYLLGPVNHNETGVWESDTGEKVGTLPGRLYVNAMGVVGGKTAAVTTRTEAALFLREIPTGDVLRTFTDPVVNPQSGGERSVVLSPGGKVLALMTIGFEPARDEPYSYLCLWDTATAKLLHRIKGTSRHRAGAYPLTFTPDCRLLLTSGDEGLQLIEVATGKVVRRIGAPAASAARADFLSGGGVWSKVRFSPCGRLVACHIIDYRFGNSDLVHLFEYASGSPRFQFQGYSIRSLAFSPDGRTLATGENDATILLWDLRQHGPETALTPKELEAHWSGLVRPDAQQGWQAMRRLAHAPRDCVPFLGKHLKPLYGPPPDEATVKALLARLDSNSFATREAAARDLTRLGRSVRPFLLKALADKPTLEVSRRIERLLLGTGDWDVTADELRQLRALEILEMIGTDEARQVAAQLTEANAGSVVSGAARATLERWKKTTP